MVLPSKLSPPIVIGFANLAAVAALPVKLPMNVVDVILLLSITVVPPALNLIVLPDVIVVSPYTSTADNVLFDPTFNSPSIIVFFKYAIYKFYPLKILIFFYLLII